MNASHQIRITKSGWAAFSTSAAIAVWAVSVVAGWALIQRYDMSTGATPNARCVDAWPPTTSLAHQPGRVTVVFFMHPKCPCTRASLQELNRLYASLGSDLLTTFDTQFVSTVPTDANETWLDTGTLETARQFPGGQVIVDHDGREAARFGASTSGTVMVFAANGRRLYAGGVTAARGHEGDNAGRDTVAQILGGKSTDIRELPTFGCLLCLPNDESPGSRTEDTATNAVAFGYELLRRTQDATDPRP